MNEFVVKDFTYRIKRMNAIELLAIRSIISFNDYEKLLKCYDTLLTKVEVKIKDKWLIVKQNNDYYPVELEYDVEAVEELIKNVLQYVMSTFQKSSASK